MLLNIIQTNQFKRSLKKYKNNKKILVEFKTVLELLIEQKPIPTKYRDHELIGKYKGLRELHIRPDDLLIYFIIQEDKTITLVDIGNHSNLF